MEDKKSFKDLRVWQEGHVLVLAIYRLSQQFPKGEQFALTSQIRRAAVSVTSNLAEGYGRRQQKDKEHFYIMSRGSLDEVRNQLLIAADLGYISKEAYEQEEERAVVIAKMTNALLRAHKNF